MATPKIKIYRLNKGYSSINDNDIQGMINDQLLPIVAKKLKPLQSYQLVGVTKQQGEILVPINSVETKNIVLADYESKINIGENKFIVTNKENLKMNVTSLTLTDGRTITFEGYYVDRKEWTNTQISDSNTYSYIYTVDDDSSSAGTNAIRIKFKRNLGLSLSLNINNLWFYNLVEEKLENLNINNKILVDGSDSILLTDGQFYDNKFLEDDIYNLKLFKINDGSSSSVVQSLVEQSYYTIDKTNKRIVFNENYQYNSDDTYKLIVNYFGEIQENSDSFQLYSTYNDKLYNGSNDDEQGINKNYLQFLYKGLEKDTNSILNRGKIVKQKQNEQYRLTKEPSSSVYFLDAKKGIVKIKKNIGILNLDKSQSVSNNIYTMDYYYETNPAKLFISDYSNWVTGHMRMNPDVFYGVRDYAGDDYIDANNEAVNVSQIPQYIQSKEGGYIINYRLGSVQFGQEKQVTDQQSTEKGKVRANFAYLTGIGNVTNQQLAYKGSSIKGYTYHNNNDSMFPQSVGKRWLYRSDINQHITMSFTTIDEQGNETNLPSQKTISQKLNQFNYNNQLKDESESESNTINYLSNKDISLSELNFFNLFKVQKNTFDNERIGSLNLNFNIIDYQKSDSQKSDSQKNVNLGSLNFEIVKLYYNKGWQETEISQSDYILGIKITNDYSNSIEMSKNGTVETTVILNRQDDEVNLSFYYNNEKITDSLIKVIDFYREEIKDVDDSSSVDNYIELVSFSINNLDNSDSESNNQIENNGE